MFLVSSAPPHSPLTASTATLPHAHRGQSHAPAFAAGGTGDAGDRLAAAGLDRYDAALIERIYRDQPRRLLVRLWQTLVPIAALLLAVGIDMFLGRFRQEDRVRQRARELCQLLVDLGPAFVKAGQALSTRPDLVPPVVLEELSALQDQLPPFSNSLAMACIREDLGAPASQLFASLSDAPISAASLGQVYRGQLHTGEDVAVKVQRPGLREQITLDLFIVRRIATWVKRRTSFVRSDLIGLVDELGTRVFEEMDYLHEAANAERFARLHAHNPRIAVPGIYGALTSRRVLTMEWISGTKLTQLQDVRTLGLDPEEMIAVGVQCSLQQLLEHGYFHADPHPGNLLALADGRLAYLDFGMMSNVTRESRVGLIQAVVHLVNKDFDQLAKDFVRLGFLTEEVNLEPIIPAFRRVFRKALDSGVSRMDFKAVTDDLSGVMYRFPFRVPPYYALIIRSLVTLEGIALSINPDFKILGAAYPYFATRLLVDPDPELRGSLRDMLFSADTFRWNRLDELLTSAAGDRNLDLDNLLDHTIDFLFSESGGLLRRQLVAACVDGVDTMGWNAVCRIGQQLPVQWRPQGLLQREPAVTQVPPAQPLADLLAILSKLPGFEPSLLWRRLPRLLGEPALYAMGRQFCMDLAERGVVRFLRDVVLPQQGQQGAIGAGRTA